MQMKTVPCKDIAIYQQYPEMPLTMTLGALARLGWTDRKSSPHIRLLLKNRDSCLLSCLVVQKVCELDDLRFTYNWDFQVVMVLSQKPDQFTFSLELCEETINHHFENKKERSMFTENVN